MQRENDIQAPTAAEAIDEAQEVLERIEPEQQKPEKKKRKLSPAGQILIAMLLAIAAGLLLQSHADFAENDIGPFSSFFLNLIKFIIAPIVLFSIIADVLSLSDIRKIGMIGGTTLVYYLCTTALATAIACLTRLFHESDSKIK